MVQLTTAATATVAVILAVSAYAAPVASVEGTDISARSEHSHTHAHGTHHHHAAPSRRDLDNVEDLDARFFRKIARKIFGRDLSSVETELEARDLIQDSEELEARFFRKIARKIFGREFDELNEELEARHEHDHHHQHEHAKRALEEMSDEELQARAPFFRKIARKIFGREFDELNEVEARDVQDGEELEARHEHSHHHLHEHVKRALEEMSDEELQARAPIFRRIARKIFGRDLSDEELEARAPLFFLPKIAKKILGRELEEDLEARIFRRPGGRPIGWRGAAIRPREEDRSVCFSFLIY
ncbi:hypothetical protein EST38_g4609 [Candolleomyces aberdarensis]|uniref:Uncharacterized protein n=1 Tax=Candolleomyces aberdarensis TaxID=2316362 RepID=A0A4V1Q488_9AGAR|nr:hypothetical protein EST38_g4609 [Candolleomyces aberdarensis]